jgi:hypothetical protein
MALLVDVARFDIQHHTDTGSTRARSEAPPFRRVLQPFDPARCENQSAVSRSNSDPLAASCRSQRVPQFGFALHVGQNAIAAGILSLVERSVAALDQPSH